MFHGIKIFPISKISKGKVINGRSSVLHLLDEEPSKKSTLEFCFKKGEVELEAVVRNGHKVNIFDLKEEDKPENSECISFELERGDALVFGMLTLHRTIIKDPSMLDRLSVEFRITTEDEMNTGKDYFNIDSLSMVKG